MRPRRASHVSLFYTITFEDNLTHLLLRHSGDSVGYGVAPSRHIDAGTLALIELCDDVLSNGWALIIERFNGAEALDVIKVGW